MPRSNQKKIEKSSGGGRKNVLNMMMGYDDDNDGLVENEDEMEAELAAILGGGSQLKKQAKKKPTKLLDWSLIDAQVASSMKDIDEDPDEELTAEDETDLLGELNDLIDDDQEEEPAHLTPEPLKAPSPQPTSFNSLQLLKDRKQMYETAATNAQATGQSSKVRRLQRGIKTLDGLIRNAKAGKSVQDDDIPPPVAAGQPSSIVALSGSSDQPGIDTSSLSSPTTPTLQPVSKLSPPKPSSAAHSPALVQVDPASISSKIETKSVSTTTLQVLEARQLQYRNAALSAKKAGNKEDALTYFKILKQFDPVIEAAKCGQDVDLSKMPPSLKASDNLQVQELPSTVQQHSSSPLQQNKSVIASPQTNALSQPKTILEALEQRMAKYQSTSDEAAKEGNGGKARRMGRIVKQYKDAIRTHKLGKSVNFDELPVPPGFPPIPGVKEIDQEQNLMQKATALLQESTEEASSSRQSEATQKLHPPATTLSQGSSPQKIGDSSSQQKPPSKQTKKAPSTSYEKQLNFLTNRQSAFRLAALDAKKRGDKKAALEYLRKMKGFDDMVEAAKSGMKVDISRVPQPPAEYSSNAFVDEGFDVIENYEIPHKSKQESSKNTTADEDDALFSRLFESLQQQVKKARAYAQQMTQSGDVSGAEHADRLAALSQSDLDYVRSCRRHGDSPPRFFYQNETFEVVHMNADLGSDDLQLTIVQCIDLHCSKDAKLFIEIEMPFPHDNPIKSKTDEGKGNPQNPQFPGANITVPFNRKLKSNQRAIKNKSVKLDVVQKGGFLRSDKTIGSAVVKLNPLENHCEIHAVEELKDGRNIVGKLEAYVKLRTPLLASDSQIIKERWLLVEHTKRIRHAVPVPSSNKSLKTKITKSSGTSSSTTNSSGTSSRSSVNVTIAALPVLELDLKIVSARIAECRKKKTSAKDYEKEALDIQHKIDSTKKYLKEGGSHAKSEYIKCLTGHYQHLYQEAQIYTKQGKREQAKLSLTKRSLVKKELDSFQGR